MKRSFVLLAVIALCVYGYYLYQTTPHTALAFPAASLMLGAMHTPGATVAPRSTADPDSLVGRPSVSVAAMNQVLQHAGSPALGLGQTLYALGVQYHIDAAYALAFFHHESGYGRYGIARVTHSLGNIVCTPGWVCLHGFRSYASWQAGARDWFVLIASYIVHGRATLAAVLALYAPEAAGNNTSAYIQAVRQDVHQWRNGQVSQ